MFRNIILMLLISLGGLVFKYLMSILFRYNPRKTKYGLVRPGIAVLITGGLSALFGGGAIYVMLASHTSRGNLCFVPCAGVFLVVGVWGIVSWFCCKIWYDEETFTVRKLFTKRKYFYSDITGILEGESVYLFMKKGGVSIDSISQGGRWFIKTAKEKYAEVNEGREIPEVSNFSNQIFKRYFEQPEEFIILAAVLLSFVGGILAYINIPPSEKNAEYFELNLSAVAKSGDDLTLYFEGFDESFIIKQYHDFSQNTELLWTTETRHADLYVNAEYTPPRKGRPGYYQICNLEDSNGNTYVTYDLVRKQEAKWRTQGNVFIGIILVLSIAYMIVNATVRRKRKRIRKVKRR